MTRRLAPTLLLLASLSLATAPPALAESSASRPATRKTAAVRVGAPAPDFTLNTPDGEERSLPGADGTVLLVFFRGTW